jgi:hypothetical protein
VSSRPEAVGTRGGAAGAPPPLPELGPWLGRLAEVGSRATAPDLDLDAIRLALVTALFERGAEARALLRAGDGSGARAALDRRAVLDVWNQALERVNQEVLRAIDGRLRRAASRSGAPKRRLRSAAPSADDRSMLRARLDAASIPLERAVDRRPAPATDLGDWTRRACAGLEESWDALEASVWAELAEWDRAAAELDAWRPRRNVLVVGWAVAVLIAAWLGLAVGGYLPRPHWLDPVADWFWSLPWP